MTKKSKTPQELPKVEQPFQLELFRLTDAPQTNSFDFYEGIPRFLVGGDDSRYIKPDGSVGKINRNKDGTAQPIERLYEYSGRSYILTIYPAPIKQKDGSFKSMFPGVREEIIEFTVHKLAVQQGLFTGGSEDKFAVFTNLYRIQEELKKRKGSKHPSYNYKQINEALKVLSLCRMTLKGEAKGEEWDLSPFAERISKEDENEWINEHIKEKVSIYLELNSLIRRDVLAQKWRQIPYDEIMQEESYLARWFRKRLSNRFTYAQLGKDYNIKLSTIINESGISPYVKLTDNLAYVKKTLLKMDIVADIIIEKITEVNPKTHRKIMVDALIRILPTKRFVNEVIGANSRHKHLDTAVSSEEGLPLLEPKRSDFKSIHEYEKAKQEYRAQIVTLQRKRLGNKH